MPEAIVKSCLLGVGMLSALGAFAAGAAAAPGDTSMVRLEAPIETWDEAIPIGNGLLGGLLWGSTNRINLSLDRGDLWDERLPAVFGEEGWNFGKLRALVAAGNQAEINRLFDDPYHEPAPTKLPGGRLVLTLSPDRKAASFALDLRQAVGSVDLGGGTLETYFHAREPVAMMRVDDPDVAVRFIRPAGLDRLGYGPAQFGEEDGVTWMVQEAALGLRYAVVVAWRVTGQQTELAMTIAATTGDRDPLAAGTRRVREALSSGYDAMLVDHRTWWDTFWATSSVTLPDLRLQRHYDLVKYFYGAASRPDAPPMPLQGVWTRDDGGLPPWKGDYHHDLNTQMTYLPYHAAGLTDAGLSFINMCWDRLPAYRRFARDFFGVDGAAIASVATLAGKPTGGWAQYSLTAPNGLWVGHSFYLHWRYTMDDTFLRTRAYPWLSEIASGIVNLLEERDGKLYLPLSSSPEIHNNSLRAWLSPNANYDLALMQWAFEALEEMAVALGRKADAGRWRGLRDKLDPLAVDDDQVLMFARGEPFNVSHRHHSHTMAIHPLGRLHMEQGETEQAVIDATLDRMIARGTQAWTGYSFSWFAGMLARCGRAEEALRYLVDYERAFTLRNGFHANGDQIGAGLSGFRYRPFTLEGNFLAMDAIHEMLLQTWAPEQTGPEAYLPLVRLFPSTPKPWKRAAFEGLRAEGAYRVSARREGGATAWFRIEATRKGTLRLLDNFGGRTPRFIRGDLRREDGIYRGAVEPGTVIEALLTNPGAPLEPEVSASGKYTGSSRREGAPDPGQEARRVGPDLYAIGDVRIDARDRSVTLPARINMREHVIEYALVTEDGKLHESLLSTSVQPVQVHLACLLAGITSPLPSSADPPAPSPHPVRVEVTWDRNGPPARHPLHELLVLKERGDGPERVSSPMPPCTWLYGRPWHPAGGEGSIISLIRDPVALVNNGGRDRDDDDAHAPRTALLPAVGIPVRVVLSAPGTEPGAAGPALGLTSGAISGKLSP